VLGGPCPLCEFPTHAWKLRPEPVVLAQILKDFPSFDAENGLCERCADMYELRTQYVES
jgi:hypothetical protein